MYYMDFPCNIYDMSFGYNGLGVLVKDESLSILSDRLGDSMWINFSDGPILRPYTWHQARSCE